MLADDEFIFHQMVSGTSGNASRAAGGDEVRVADPARFRHLAARVNRPRSTRTFSSTAPIARDEFVATLDAVFCIDATGHCVTASAGNIQGLEAVGMESGGGEPVPMTPGRAGPLRCIESGELRRALFEQVQGRFWLVLLYGDPRPYIERYGARAFRYIFMEAGLVSHQLGQAAHDAGWASCIVGGFDDSYFRGLLAGASPALLPVCLHIVGRPLGKP